MSPLTLDKNVKMTDGWISATQTVAGWWPQRCRKGWQTVGSRANNILLQNICYSQQLCVRK